MKLMRYWVCSPKIIFLYIVSQKDCNISCLHNIQINFKNCPSWFHNQFKSSCLRFFTSDLNPYFYYQQMSSSECITMNTKLKTITSWRRQRPEHLWIDATREHIAEARSGEPSFDMFKKLGPCTTLQLKKGNINYAMST